MQYIISQEEYENLLNHSVKEIAQLQSENADIVEALNSANKEIRRLRSIIKDIAGTIQTMSAKAEPLKGSDFDIDEHWNHGTVTIDEYGQVHRD